MESTPPFAALALALTSQDWTALGLGEDPIIAATNDFDVTVERLTALLLIRVVAVAMPKPAPLSFQDWSTTTICRAALLQNQPWPEPINDAVIDQLRLYIATILKTYHDTPYHGVPHAYHVTISINKLLDLILNTDIQGNRLHPTFGLRNDPLMHLVLVFSAVIHDAEHRGIPNRQLVIENDPLAILYNDQSIAENRSLFLAFAELLKDDYKDLRNAMFQSVDEYRRFRKAAINLILTTDIASPERTQVGKSKWKEAFGDPFETVERKVRKEIQRKQSMSSAARPSVLKVAGRRASACSMYSEITTDIQEEGDEVSPSVTPDSSYNGDDYDSIDDDLSQDGMIVSAKPFSNIVSSSQLNSSQTIRRVEPVAGKLGAAQLGYEPDTSSNLDLGYSDNDNPPSKSAADGVAEDGTHIRTQSPTTKHTAVVPRWGNKKHLSNPLYPSKNSEFKQQAVRNMSMSDFVSDMERETTANVHGGDHMSKQMAKFQRRFSTSVVVNPGTSSASQAKKYKFRLGILRAVDLSGEAIETYSRGSATGGVSMAGMSIRTPSVRSPSGTVIDDADEFDELKMTVIMEQLMTACDVAHNLQSWEHMVQWSNQLFLELKKAHKEGKGGDPKNNWFENQIGFLESYLLPLARRLEDAGVFGDMIGPVFAHIVEANRDRWLADGLGITSAIILEGRKQFPVEGDFVSQNSNPNNSV